EFKWISLGVLLLIYALTYFLFANTSKGFIPSEDDSFLSFSLAMPPGSSLYRTTTALKTADSIIQKYPAVLSVNSISGYNVVDATNSPSFAMGYINLKPKKERGDIKDINDIIVNLRERLQTVERAKINVFSKPTVQGFGDFSGVEFVLQDREEGEFSHCNQIAKDRSEERRVG